MTEEKSLIQYLIRQLAAVFVQEHISIYSGIGNISFQVASTYIGNEAITFSLVFSFFFCLFCELVCVCVISFFREREGLGRALNITRFSF